MPLLFIVLSLRLALRCASLLAFLSSLACLRAASSIFRPAVGAGITLSLGFVVPPISVLLGAFGIVLVEPDMPDVPDIPDVEPDDVELRPAVGAGVTLSVGFVVPGVAVAPLLAAAPAPAPVPELPIAPELPVAPELPMVPELVLPAAPGRAVAPLPAPGAGVTASVGLVLPPIGALGVDPLLPVLPVLWAEAKPPIISNDAAATANGIDLSEDFLNDMNNSLRASTALLKITLANRMWLQLSRI